MAKLAVISTGGKQYLVRENQEITVDKLPDAKGSITLPALAVFDDTGTGLELGTPALSKAVKAEVLEEGKGEKIRVARFKAKVRYRKVRGFRPQLTKIKILQI